MKKLLFVIILSSALILGFGLRAQELISGNFLFLLDQGRDMMAVKGILYDQHMTLIGPSTSLRGVFQGPLWYYLLALLTGIFGGNPWGGILLMFTISVMVLATVYFWIKKLFGIKTALISLFLFSISPEAIAAATYTWNPNPMWLLVTLYIFITYSMVYKSKKFNIALWPIIGLMFHFQTALGVFILLATIIYTFLFQRKIIFNKYFVIGVSLFIITFLPQIFFDLRHNFLMSNSILSIFKGSEQGLFAGTEKSNYFLLFGNHIDSLYENFRSSFMNDGFAKYFVNLFFAGIILSIALIIGKLKTFSKNESNFISLISKIIFIIILLTFIYPFPLRYWFLTGFQSFYLILLGIILGRFFNQKLGRVFVALFFIVSFFYSVKKIDLLYFNPPNDGGAEKIKGKIAAIDYIYNDAKDKNYGLLIFNPAVYNYAYDYLIYWYGKKTYGYIPSAEKKDTFYLLIEPDHAKPWSYKGWLETVIKSGNVVKEITLPTGLIIQKRSIL